MSIQRRNWLSWGLVASCLSQTSAAGRADGYTYGQPMPVTCLNRTIDSGEHITDDLGKLQFIPFPTCKETSFPLALRYGASETVNCTIDSLPDELYHLLEYYVHSDVPMTCRVPTAPLDVPVSSAPDNKDAEEGEGNTLSVLNENGPPYTPITFALQGTLQKSHLHIWTDMNVLAHSIPQIPLSSKKNKKGKEQQGYIVAGTAYSVPEFEDKSTAKTAKEDKDKSDEEKEASAVSEAAREPWTAGHGTKVIRGEPLTFTFHVSWIEGARGIGWPSRDISTSGSSGAGWFFTKVVFFVLAASVGALVALYWERNQGGRRRGWKGDGILGVPAMGLGMGGVGVSFGNGAKANGNGYGVPPPSNPEILNPLSPPHMKLLVPSLSPNFRRIKILPVFRPNINLPPEHRTKLKLNFAGLLAGALVGQTGGASESRFNNHIAKMSSITIGTLPRMSRDTLSALLLSTSTPSKLAIIDVRDHDHIGGHIYSSTWVPSATLDHRVAELVRTLQDKEKVVFHCALSQQRGPSAALRYSRERERLLGVEASHSQEVFVLEGGFLQWQEKYGKDVRLTEAYVEDLWQEY
ncbi:hypothetical protein BJX99DRAFT_251420 [Aspergillus californicus]